MLIHYRQKLPFKKTKKEKQKIESNLKSNDKTEIDKNTECITINESLCVLLVYVHIRTGINAHANSSLSRA